jgi:enoyl-CoA hydratase/carnithine racemase
LSITDLRRDADGTATLRMQRPPANAFDLVMVAELIGAVTELAADPPAALLLAGLDGFFSAGADLKAPPIGQDGVAAINQLTFGLYGLPCPVVGAITGHAIGVGLIVALCCDLLIASQDGRYGLTEVGLGFAYPPVTLDLLRAAVTPQAAQLLILGSELHDAATCHRLGVLDEIMPLEAVLPRATAEVKRRAAMPRDAYAATKAVLRRDTLAAMSRTIAGGGRAAY